MVTGGEMGVLFVLKVCSEFVVFSLTGFCWKYLR
jgi:hypothetical protein